MKRRDPTQQQVCFKSQKETRASVRESERPWSLVHIEHLRDESSHYRDDF
jgi:hypothetical protein